MNAPVISQDPEGDKKVKVLIMGDEFAQNCAVASNHNMNDGKYDIKGTVKPNLDIADIFKNVFTKTKKPRE